MEQITVSSYINFLQVYTQTPEYRHYTTKPGLAFCKHFRIDENSHLFSEISSLEDLHKKVSEVIIIN